MKPSGKLTKLRQIITESIRIQLGDDSKIKYINVGNALADVMARQNHAIFARRGCGKTLLLHHSTKILPSDIKTVYLNCEDFKKHSFPNVLIEILDKLFGELERNLTGWFGKKRKSRQIIQKIRKELVALKRESDSEEEDIKKTTSSELNKGSSTKGSTKILESELSISGEISAKRRDETEKKFKIRKEKIKELDVLLPDLKVQVREFFELSKTVRTVFIQIDDLYHLKRADQAFVVDYIHRLCKDVPLFFKIATLRHASTLYADRDGQPIGAQERHDYQPINIDYMFNDFKRTKNQNWEILIEFGKLAGLKKDDVEDLFKGEGFDRLVMAGGGVPRDVLSLFLEVLSSVQESHGDRIGKDDVRMLSKSYFERRIEDLKQDSQGDEIDGLLGRIYALREFCLGLKKNVFLVPERQLQKMMLSRI